MSTEAFHDGKGSLARMTEKEVSFLLGNYYRLFSTHGHGMFQITGLTSLSRTSLRDEWRE